MRRILLQVYLAFALAGLGSSGLGGIHGVAFAEQGDTSGRVHACAEHAAQHARGHGYGLRCPAPSITTAITYTAYGAIPLITVRGANFAPNSSVTVTVTSLSTTYRCHVSLTSTTDRTGSFTSAPIQFGQIRQPSCLPATVTVTDAAGNSATATV
jgi:hypothetical protein